MRDETAVINPPSANEDTSTIHVMARKDPYSAGGFTAVNGSPPRNTSFRPADDADPHNITVATKKTIPVPSSPTRKTPPPPVQDQAPRREMDQPVEAERPHENGNLSDSGKKRKRDDHPGDPAENPTHRDQAQGAEENSPKRQSTHQLEPPINLERSERPIDESPIRSTEQQESEQSVQDHHSRTNSSTARWNPGEPLPQPRPETVDGLAESLKRELGQNRTAPSSHEESNSPSDMYAHRNQYSPDDDKHPDDPKKRKRVFSNRTKTGCHTCRSRKKKCDEHKPVCNNCERGGFQCGGYGPKPPHGFKPSVATSRAPIALQSKPPYEPSHGPTGYYPHPSEEHGRSYSHWGRVPPPPSDARPPSSIDHRHPPPPHHGWPPRPGWPPGEQLPPYLSDRPLQAEYPPTIPPIHPPYPGEPHLPPPPMMPWQPPSSQLTPFRQQSGSMVRGSESNSTTSSHQRVARSLNYMSANQMSEKDKMLLGMPFMHFLDEELHSDRHQCKCALERYNEAAKPLSGTSCEEQGRFFRAVVEPPYRQDRSGHHGRQEPYTGPKGHVGTGVLVEAPFHCDYGYNLHLGDDVVIYRNCQMDDACEIRIGSRTMVGPNVRFYTTTPSMAPSARKGTKSTLAGGGIYIGEGCFIGADVTILPFRKIGNGAVVGAGSVVTKDVKENTVVAGNPARFIRMVEEGPNVERHRPEIQEQNDKTLHAMRESRKGLDR